MITVNATLGTGLYWRGGQILELGGPLAVLLSFLLVGILAWAVMQCITEMLCIWPVPGALSVYVSKFVDEELGIAVGIAYWYAFMRTWFPSNIVSQLQASKALIQLTGSRTRYHGPRSLLPLQVNLTIGIRSKTAKASKGR
jgi:amino acid permease